MATGTLRFGRSADFAAATFLRGAQLRLPRVPFAALVRFAAFFLVFAIQAPR
jgi:hypothetical protein